MQNRWTNEEGVAHVVESLAPAVGLLAVPVHEQDTRGVLQGNPRRQVREALGEQLATTLQHREGRLPKSIETCH